MNHLSRNLRSPLIAIAVLAMSASIAFAAHPAASGNGASHSNLTSGSEATDGPDETDAPETDEPSESADTGDTAGTGTNCTTDPTGLTPEELAAMTHGSIVCWAAQQVTPDGYDTHGAWVSQWAHTGKSTDASAAGKAKGAAGKAKGQSHKQ